MKGTMSIPVTEWKPDGADTVTDIWILGKQFLAWKKTFSDKIALDNTGRYPT